VQAGALLALFFALNVSQTFKELEAKQSVMIHHVYGNTSTFISITGVHAVHFIFSVMAGLIVEMLFMLFSVHNTV